MNPGVARTSTNNGLTSPAEVSSRNWVTVGPRGSTLTIMPIAWKYLPAVLTKESGLKWSTGCATKMDSIVGYTIAGRPVSHPTEGFSVTSDLVSTLLSAKKRKSNCEKLTKN